MAEKLFFLAIVVSVLIFLCRNYYVRKKVECHLWILFKENKLSSGYYVAIGDGLSARFDWKCGSSLPGFAMFKMFPLPKAVGTEEIKKFLLLDGEWIGRPIGLTWQSSKPEFNFEIFSVFNKQMLKVASA